MIKISKYLLLLLFCSINLVAQNALSESKKDALRVAYFASGCFWCVESIYESVQGVKEAISGYSGGHVKKPTYHLVGKGNTGHAETVAVYYNPAEVSYRTLVAVYFGSQDATTFGQGPDYGTVYRSVIFYQNEKEKEIANQMFTHLNKTVYKGKMVTEIVPFKKFYRAENYHQNFEKSNPKHPYIQQVSLPRLNRFKKAFPSLIKD
jgi:peptide-methionine (S)-S-oxide reductase